MGDVVGGDHTGPPAEIVTDAGVLRFWKWWCSGHNTLSYEPGCASLGVMKAVYILETGDGGDDV